MQQLLASWKRWLPAVVAILGVAGVTLVVTDENGDNRPDTIIIRIDGADADRAADDKLEVPTAAVEDARPVLEKDLRDTPSVAPEEQLRANAKTEQQVRAERQPLPTGGASQGFTGCRTSFVRNQSSRNGVRPIWQVLHYTVSPNRPGWSDVNAIVALFNNPNYQASSHFVIDREGNCAYIVPIEAKAWTQAAGNPLSVAYEIINSGREGSFMDSAGYRKLGQVMREVSRRASIPMRAGSVYPARPGIVQHKDGGLAWGGHVDITPFSSSQVIKVVTANTCTKRCQRAKSLRGRHAATHQELRRRRCAPRATTRSARCRLLHGRNRAIHNAALREHIKL